MKLKNTPVHLITICTGILLAILLGLREIEYLINFDWNNPGYQHEFRMTQMSWVKAISSIWILILSFGLFYLMVILQIFLSETISGRMNRLYKAVLVFSTTLVLFAGLSLFFVFLFRNTQNPIINLSIKHFWGTRFLFLLILSVAFSYLLIYFSQFKQAEIDKTRLLKEKSVAELAALRDQLSPHFFFNTLNTLSALIRKNQQKESLDFVENLSDIYRYTLDKGKQDFVTVREELDFLGSYNQLISRRFENALTIDVNLSKEISDYQIPTMALQILIENVIKHNQLSESNPIKVHIHSEESMLVVENNCRPKEVEDSNGLGLANLNKRCQMLLGEDILIQQKEDDFIVKIPMLKS